MSSSETRVKRTSNRLLSTTTSFRPRLARRFLAAMVGFVCYLIYGYFGFPGSYVLGAFTGFAPPNLDLNSGTGSVFEYVSALFIQENVSLLVTAVPWVVLLVAVSSGIAIGYAVVQRGLSGRVRGAALVYVAAFLLSSQLLIEPAEAAGARGLYLYQAYRLLQLDLLTVLRLLLFAAFLTGFVLAGTAVDLLREGGSSDRDET